MNITPSEDLQRILESARRLGVEMDEEEALQWLAAIAAMQADEIAHDEKTGVFGHRVVMLDFSPEELAYFRAVGRLAEFEDEPGVVETALALSGSAAQAKIQTYPGDLDYFERVHIKQADKLILSVVDALEGEHETEIVRRLLRLRDALTRQESGCGLTAEAEAARAEVIQVVNNFFHERLTALPSIREDLERLAQAVD